MLAYLKKFEKFIISSIIVMMIFVIFLSTIRLGWILIIEMVQPPFMLLKADDLLKLFGFFLMILIGIELLESIKTYLTEEKIQVEVVMSVALIAVARKIITLELSKLDGITIIGISATILSLSIGYFLLKKAHDLSRNAESYKKDLA